MPTFRELLAGTGIDARLDEQYFPEGMGHLLGSNPFDPKRLDAPGGFDFGAQNALLFAESRQMGTKALEELKRTAEPFSALRARGDGFEAFRRQDTGEIEFAPTTEIPFFETGQGGVFTGDDGAIRGQQRRGPISEDVMKRLRAELEEKEFGQKRAQKLLPEVIEHFRKGGSVHEFLNAAEAGEIEREGKQKSETMKRLLDISKRRTDIAGKIPDADPSTVSVLQQELEFLDQSRRGILEGMSDRERDQFFPGVGEAPAEDPTQIQPGVPAEDAPITAAGLDLGQNLEVIAKGGRLSSSDIQRVIPAIQSLEPTNALQQLAKDELLAAISSQPKGASAAKIWTTFIDRFKDRFNTQTTDVVGTKVEKDIKQLLRGGVFGVAASMELFRSIFE